MSAPPPGYDEKPGYEQQQGYPPPQQQGYPPPQQQGYPTQQPGYPPQAVYNPQQGAQVVTAPTTTVIVRQPGIQPNDHLVFAIMVTICCCLPFGIIAIIKSMDVRSRFTVGDFAGAEAASQEAKKWCIIGLICGIILEVIGIIIIIVYYVVIIGTIYSYG